MSTPGESVYFIQAVQSGLIKIGQTSNMPQRLQSLRTTNSEPLIVLLTVPGGIELEANFHAMFAAERDHGEWFQPSDRLLACIEKGAAEVTDSPLIMLKPPRRGLVKGSYQLTPEQDAYIQDYADRRGFASKTEALRDIVREKMDREQQQEGKVA